MGRFPSSGRGGRSLGSPSSKPRWLSVPPPILRYKAPDLSSNPFHSLSNQYSDSSISNVTRTSSTETSLVHQVNLNSTTLNGIFLQPNGSANGCLPTRNKIPNYVLATDPSTAISTSTAKPSLSPTSVANHNLSSLPHNSKLSSIVDHTNLQPPMPSSSSTHSVPPADGTDMEIDNPVSTPDRNRRDKKQRPRNLDPLASPTKKQRDENPIDPIYVDMEVDTENQDDLDANANPDTSLSTIKYVKLNSLSSEGAIRSMSDDNLLKEVVIVSKKIGSAVSLDSIKSLPKSVLIQRAIEFRDKMKSLRKAKHFRVTKDVSDQEIRDLSAPKAMSAYLASLRARSKPINKNEIDQLEPGVIIQNLIAYKAQLLREYNKAQQLPTSSTATSDQSSPPSTDPPSEAPIDANEATTDVNRYTSTVIDTTSSGNIVPPIGKESNKVNTITQRFISIRTKWYRDYFKKPHVELVKEIVRIVREVDPEMHRIPSAKDSQLNIYHEDTINPDIVYDYLWNNFTNNKTTKMFTLQFMVKSRTKSISTKIVDYMARTQNYGKVDHLHSDKIACVGFFTNFHPEHHHRERLRASCVQYIKAQHNIDVELSIFPRPISAGRGLAKTSTRAVVCEVSEDHAQLVTTALMQYKFPDYTNVKFIPFTKFEDTYTTMLCKIIDAHRQYLQDVEIIRIPKMSLTHENLAWKIDAYSSVRDLILSCNGTDAAFLHDVDVGSNNSVNIIYFISQEEKLPPFLSQLQQLLCDNICFEALQFMYRYQGSLPGLLKRL